jgi:hypothetical protein
LIKGYYQGGVFGDGEDVGPGDEKKKGIRYIQKQKL